MIAQYLGYSPPFPTITVDPAAQEAVDIILASLKAVDQQIQQNSIDSLASNVGSLRINAYAANVELAKQGTELLKELSRLVGTAGEPFPITFDKYAKRHYSRPAWV